MGLESLKLANRWRILSRVSDLTDLGRTTHGPRPPRNHTRTDRRQHQTMLCPADRIPHHRLTEPVGEARPMQRWPGKHWPKHSRLERLTGEAETTAS